MNNLSGGEIAAIITACGALVVAIGGTVVNVLMVLRKLDQAASVTDAKIDSVEAKTDVIRKSVDGAASKQVEKIESLHSMVETLRSVIADQRDTAKGLAALAAVASEASGIPDTLRHIEEHTGKTASIAEKLADLPIVQKDGQ